MLGSLRLTQPTTTEQFLAGNAHPTMERIGSYLFMEEESGAGRVTADPFLLAGFLKALRKNDKVIDLGCGSGIIPLILCSKTKVGKIVGVEADRGTSEIARKNIAVNRLYDRVEILNCDWRALADIYLEGSFSIVVSNPPYVKRGEGRISPSRVRALARYETLGTMKDLVHASKHLCGIRGSIFYIYPVRRFFELMEEFKSAGLKPKRVCFVHARASLPAKLFLVEATGAGTKSGPLITAPIFLG